MASMTALQVIATAGRRAKILAGEEAFSAAEQVNALTDLNLMMHAFQSMGISYAHTDLAIADTVNMPDGMLDNLVWMMADKFSAGDYGASLTPTDQLRVESARQALQAFYHVEQRAVIDHGLRNRRYTAFDFTRGT